jgi:hypothetical protein
MKIRIKGNSIRYRMSKTDVERFIKTGYLDETVDFGAQKFVYALKKYGKSALTASFEQSTITLYMPEQMAAEWEAPGKVGFDGIYNKLSLLIEKDFQCLDNVEEDQSDNYPNPASIC